MKKISLIAAALAALLSSIPLSAASSNPELLEGTMPSYSESARNKGIEGTVIVEILVDEQGRVFAADVVHSVSPELDALTVEAVMSWKFKPAMEDGKAVPELKKKYDFTPK